MADPLSAGEVVPSLSTEPSGAAGSVAAARPAGGLQRQQEQTTVTLHIVGPDGSKTPLKIKLSDDVSTLRALVTQMHDTADWTTQTDRREDRQDFSDWADEDTGFAEVIALEKKPHEQAIAPSSWRNPRTWLEWNDKRGKLRMMCGAYHLADGKSLSYYDIVDGSVIHPLYERYGDSMDAGAKMLSDPDWYRQQGQQARALANQASAYFGYSSSYFSTTGPSEVRSGRGESGPDGSGASSASGVAGSLLSGQTSSKFAEFFIWPVPLVDHTPKPKPDATAADPHL